MKYFAQTLPLIFLCLLSTCKQAPPNLQVRKSAPQASACNLPEPANFREAIRALDFEAAHRLAQSQAARYLLAQFEAFAMAGQIPMELAAQRLPADASPGLRAHANDLAQARAWARQDFAQVVRLAKSEDGKNTDPSTYGISAAFAQAPRQQRLDFRQEEFTVPLHVNNSGSPLIDVRINGQAYQFWLDTGAGVSVISSAVAEKVGVRPAGESGKDLNTSTKRVVQAAPAYIDSLRFGSLQVYDHPCVILNKQDLIVRMLGVPLVKIDGIIGWPLLQALDVEFDLPGRQLTVRKPQVRAVDHRNLSWYWQPFLRLKSGSGCPLHLMLDTGSSSTFFHPAAYPKLEQTPQKGGKLMRGGAGGKEVVHYDRLDSSRFWVGDHLVQMNFAEGIADKTAGQQPVILDGVIGQDILSKGKFRLDFTNRRYEFEWVEE